MRKSLLLIAIGSALVLLAIAFSNNAMEAALLADRTRSLRWGSTLFRALLAVHGVILLVVAFTRMKAPRNLVVVDLLGERREATSITVWLTLGLLSLLALALRLWRLDSDLWVDEVFTLLEYVRLPFGEIITRFPNQNQHMLFSLLAHASTVLFGLSVRAMRLPSVLFGVASIWALFLLGRRVIGVRQALLGCALMTVSYHHIWFSQNARGYMGLLFFTLLTTWLWLVAADRKTWNWWLAYAAAAALGSWMHMTMAFVIASHVLVHLISFLWQLKKGSDRFGHVLKPFAAWLLCTTFTLQLYALALPEFLTTGLHEESRDSEWTSPVWIIMESLRGLRVGFAGFAVVVGGALLFAFGWLEMYRRNRQTALLMILPPVLAGSTMLALGHNLWPRFFFFSMGFALLIAIHGAVELPGRFFALVPSLRLAERWQASAGTLLAGAMIVASLVTVPRNYALPKQDFTGARDFVEQHREAGDAVVAVGIAGVIYGRYLAPQWQVAQNIDELRSVAHDHTNLWLVYTLPIEVKAYRPDIWKSIEQDYTIVKIFPGTLGGGEVYVCRQRSTQEMLYETSRNFSSTVR